MQEENHYVKVVVDGTRVQDSYLCNGNPTGSSCTYKVYILHIHHEFQCFDFLKLYTCIQFIECDAVKLHTLTVPYCDTCRSIDFGKR
jgi:hypothetical protein